MKRLVAFMPQFPFIHISTKTVHYTLLLNHLPSSVWRQPEQNTSSSQGWDTIPLALEPSQAWHSSQHACTLLTLSQLCSVERFKELVSAGSGYSPGRFPEGGQTCSFCWKSNGYSLGNVSHWCQYRPDGYKASFSSGAAASCVILEPGAGKPQQSWWSGFKRKLQNTPKSSPAFWE